MPSSSSITTILLDDPMQRAARCPEGIHPLLDLGIVHHRGCMVGFAPRIDDEGSSTPPVLTVHAAPDTVTVGGRVGAGEGNPQEVVEGAGNELTIVDHHHEGKCIDGIAGSEGSGERAHNLVV